MNNAPALDRWLYIACALASSIIISRLAYLQLWQAPIYQQQSKRNYVRYERIPAARGDILDCHGQPLATNRAHMHLYWHGTGNRQLSKQQYNLLRDLSRISDRSFLDDESVQQIKRAEKHKHKLLLISDLSFDLLSCIEERYGHHPNISIEATFKRWYPYGQMACHIIGYLGNSATEPIGRSGLERLAQRELQGAEGRRAKTMNAQGKLIAMHELTPSKQGKTITCTLDLQLQQLTEQCLHADFVGTFILMDPATGAIKALVSRPSFDPGIFLAPIQPHQWQALQKSKPFLNRAINCSYPPGSFFKLITMSAALETGLIKPDDRFSCKGYYLFAGRKYSCARHAGHGSITPMQGLALSCNTLFYELGRQLSIDTLADYAQRFGLGSTTGFALAEQSGLVPSTAWKREVKGEPWWPGETLSASIGQSFLLVTPLQIARMVSSIFTEYVVTPRILEREPITKQSLAIEADTLDFLQCSMRSVVTHGTGHRVRHIDDMQIYAKTSTAQMSTMSMRSLGSNYLEHGWFAAYFQYQDTDPLTLVILVEHAGCSRVPVLIAKDFLLAYRDMLLGTHSR